MDARIRLQKCVTNANKLPHVCKLNAFRDITIYVPFQPEKLAPYVSTADGRVAARRFLTEALMLSDDLFELRHVRRISSVLIIFFLP